MGGLRRPKTDSTKLGRSLVSERCFNGLLRLLELRPDQRIKVSNVAMVAAKQKRVAQHRLLVGGHLRDTVAARLRSRRAWLTGAILLGVVILKLFLVDLSGSETVARIVSFLVVGILMLVIGDFSPLPPKRVTDEADVESASTGFGIEPTGQRSGRLVRPRPICFQSAH